MIKFLPLLFLVTSAYGYSVRISPEYPQAAVNQCIEGWAVVSFTVEANGKTADYIVTSSEPKDIFDESAIQTIKNLNYSSFPNFKSERVEGVIFKLSWAIHEGDEKFKHCYNI